LSLKTPMATYSALLAKASVDVRYSEAHRQTRAQF
jgi:hypothetical protein